MIMELRAYWKLLKRRWLLVVVPAAVVLVVGLLTYSPPPTLYNAGVRFVVAQEPAPEAELSDEERLANWRASEYIAATLLTWARSGQFAELVSARLAQQGIVVAPGTIVGAAATDSSRSVLTLSMTHPDPVLVEAMMHAAAAVLVEQNDVGLPQLGGEPAELVQLDEPIVNQVPPGLLEQLRLPLRLVLALAAGLGLALVVDYLDPTVRDRDDLVGLGLP
ncbi:MAG: hypothetical protein R3300_20795, partial [Candidatus Promineifilaceae bacterium]|nr:hypothetical protein [Candidatus Promineifilaceae bacterium]